MITDSRTRKVVGRRVFFSNEFRYDDVRQSTFADFFQRA